MKMPSLQFYPADWRKDPGVQALGYFERGVWFELLCLMHESSERGVLLLNGMPMPEPALERALGLDNQTLNQTLTTLLTYGVASKRDRDGALYSRRMVRDEHLCQVRREAGKKGGNPRLLNQTPNQKPTTGDKQVPTPSSSSSISSSTSVQTPPTPVVGVLAEGSKKNEGAAAVEELPAEGSLASASHTGLAAPAADSRPEFRPDPEWAPQMRLVAEQMIAYWGLSQFQQQQRMAITRFCRVIFEQGQGPYLIEQFAAYRAYKDLTGERKHDWDSYIGKEAEHYQNPDAGWNKTTWADALTQARQNPKYASAQHRIGGGPAASAGRATTLDRESYTGRRPAAPAAAA